MVNLTLSGVAWERASGSAWTQLRWEDHTLWMAHFLTGILDWAGERELWCDQLLPAHAALIHTVVNAPFYHEPEEARSLQDCKMRYLRTLAALPRDQGSIPSTHMGANNCLELSEVA